MPRRQRRLPHIYPEGTALFLTWHLHGSLPASQAQPPGLLPSGKAFVWMDRRLDAGAHGPTHLARPEFAQLVVDSIRRGEELGHYELVAWVVMVNHVHMLIWPKITPERLMKSLKGTTARLANRVLGRTGKAFWQRESYDHWVRNTEELEKIRAYIENNPVKAGMVRTACEYRWSSAGIDTSVDTARTSACATGGGGGFLGRWWLLSRRLLLWGGCRLPGSSGGPW